MLSLGICMRDPNIKRILEDIEMQLRARLDPRELKETSDEIKAIYEKIIMHESEIVRTINKEDMVTFNCEKSKLYDSIEAEYGMKIHHIYEYVNKFHLNEDVDIMHLRDDLKMTQQSNEDATMLSSKK